MFITVSGKKLKNPTLVIKTKLPHFITNLSLKRYLRLISGLPSWLVCGLLG